MSHPILLVKSVHVSQDMSVVWVRNMVQSVFPRTVKVCKQLKDWAWARKDGTWTLSIKVYIKVYQGIYQGLSRFMSRSIKIYVKVYQGIYQGLLRYRYQGLSSCIYHSLLRYV